MENTLREQTAVTLKRLRQQTGLSQEQLAKKSGIDRTYISGVERGVRNITLDSLEVLIAAIGSTPETFLSELQKSLSNQGSDS